MKTIVKAFVELVNYMESAKFDDPDEAQGAEEIVSWCLCEPSAKERSLLCKFASERASQLRAEGASEEAVEFYDRFVANVKAQYF